ncbi:nuclear transport factor 2 family protein [Streptomyces sp. NPDC093223]|uniref:nuclear transport factor 2 family protein n=1 Tax=Streptomyces sp. NPDC093223 TaxID=3366033 RepID=UPI0037FD4B88
MSENGKLVLNAMTALFVNRDTSVVERYWSENYLQHNPEMVDGRDHIAGFVASLGEDFRYEPGVVIDGGEYVAIHGRYSGLGPTPFMAVDIFRIENGKLTEHWDVLQEEVPAAATKSGRPMTTKA